MDKNDIKNMLRESLVALSEDKEKKDGDKKSDRPLDQGDQNSIQQRIKAPLAPSMADVCEKSGIFPNATSNASQRSACRKKIKQEDGQGLEPKEKDAVEKALKIS
jgi:hypothetical protein